MIYFFALIPATGLVIGGYVVFYLSARSEGGLRTFGKYLGFWAFTLAALVILGAIFAAAHGHRPGMMGMRGGMHGRMHGPWPGGPRFFRPPVGGYRYGPGGPASSGPTPPPPVGAPNASESSSSTSATAR
jgi:hypothetical protein